jgi:Rrf2 family protein
MFSKACEYAIKAIIYIYGRSKAHEHVNTREVARAIDSPVAFTAKILQALAGEGIIHSIKGAGGGYTVTGGPDRRIPLLQIVKAVDGDRIYNGCGLGLERCDASNPCPVHDQFVAIRDDLRQMLATTYIKDLANDVAIGQVVLKR